MKKLFSITVLLIVLASCGDDDTNSDSNAPLEFINQNLQGQIDGIAFTNKGGFFDEGSEEGFMRVRLFDASEENDVCDVIISDFVAVSINIPREVGLYEIPNAFSSDPKQINLFNPDDDGFPLTIITEGLVEILSITDTQVVGRMATTLDNENTVNGNFTVVSCAEN